MKGRIQAHDNHEKARDMDALYHYTLLVAMVLAGAGTVLTGVAWVQVRQGKTVQWLVRLATLAGVGALGLGMFSLLIHLFFGHGPTSDEPMAVGVFFLHHTAYGAVALGGSVPLLIRWLKPLSAISTP